MSSLFITDHKYGGAPILNLLFKSGSRGILYMNIARQETREGEMVVGGAGDISICCECRREHT